MPSGQISGLASKSGKSVDAVEKIWNNVKSGLKKSGKSESDDNFFAILVSVVKKKLKIESKVLSFKQFLLEYNNDITDPKTSYVQNKTTIY